jgi:hypothetical protein
MPGTPEHRRFQRQVFSRQSAALFAMMSTPGVISIGEPERAREPTRAWRFRCRRPARSSAAFSPIMIEGALVLPDVSVGMIEASATRRPSMPQTQSWSSTTASAFAPIRQVPKGLRRAGDSRPYCHFRRPDGASGPVRCARRSEFAPNLSEIRFGSSFCFGLANAEIFTALRPHPPPRRRPKSGMRLFSVPLVDQREHRLAHSLGAPNSLVGCHPLPTAPVRWCYLAHCNRFRLATPFRGPAIHA